MFPTYRLGRHSCVQVGAKVKYPITKHFIHLKLKYKDFPKPLKWLLRYTRRNRLRGTTNFEREWCTCILYSCSYMGVHDIHVYFVYVQVHELWILFWINKPTHVIHIIITCMLCVVDIQKERPYKRTVLQVRVLVSY